MITEKDLIEAIAECQGQRNPNANTCIKLAAYYTILQHINGGPAPAYSYDAGPETFSLDSDSEFTEIINKKSPADYLPVLDELMMTLEVLNPALYGATIRKLRN